jgi:hypothetical protein
VLAIAAVAVVNVNLGAKSNDLSAVSMANVEALASGENEWNHWTDWFDQGFTKDEYVKNVKCTVTSGWTYGFGGTSYGNTTTYEGHMDICCEPGYANCTSTSCQ